ncbi:MAG: NYN domain-containing protein [Synergistaceae bacterium]|jgi:uncharacterized LabA/DUF88 family protein|nr:NYN domain-containing protein [Synergistaceae bacterium]
MPNQECNIALFVDLENFIGGAATLGLPIDISKVIIKLREIGNVRIRKAYGDMQKALQSVGLGNHYYEIRRDFHSNLIEVEDIPYLTPHKNASDIKLVVETLSVGYQNEYITHFAILASDRDYVPLYQKLRALNKTVITIGVDQMHMNSMVREASDRLFYYEHLFLGDTVSALYETEEQNLALRNEFFELLTRSIKKLEHESITVSGEILLEAMRNARSDFDFALVGCKSFSHFLKLAVEYGYIEENQDHTFKISATPNGTPKAPHSRENIANAAATINAKDTQKEAKIYKKILSEALKIPFPTLQERRDIVSSIHKILSQEFGVTLKEILNRDSFRASYSLTFNSIADMVHENMQEDGLEANRHVVYKIILGLHFARCFYEQRGEISDINSIEVTGIARSYDIWEDELYRNYIGQIKNNMQSKTVQDAALATLLYESTDDEALRKIQLLRA